MGRTLWVMGICLPSVACGTTEDERRTNDAGAGGSVGPDGEAGSDAGTGGSGGPNRSDGGGIAGCNALAAGEIETIDDDDAAGLADATTVWTAPGFVAIWSDDDGYRLLELGADGTPIGTSTALSHGQSNVASPRIAVAGDAIAIVDQRSEGEDQRQTCHLAIVRLADRSVAVPGFRFSDMPDGGSILNEVSYCDVVRSGDAFVAVWQQYVSNTSSAWSVFAQRFRTNGEATGARLELLSGDENARGLAYAGSVASDGQRVVAASSTFESSVLVLLDGESTRTVSLDLAGPLLLSAAHEGFLAHNGTEIAFVDSNGAVTAGAIALDHDRIAPLDDGWVRVSHDEFLVARALDPRFQPTSPAAGLSDDRGAGPGNWLFAPDGSWTALPVYDGAGTRVLRLTCSDEVGPAPGPQACPAEDPLVPLDDGCTDEVCHLAIRLDYLTLGLRGYAVAGGSRATIDTAGARDAAGAVFDANSEFLSGVTVSGASAGLFKAHAEPSDFGAFALVGAESGIVVTAGGIVWSGRGSYWVPEVWKSASVIRCTREQAVPAATFIDSARCDSFDDTVAPTPNQALDVALSTNLAAHVAAEGAFEAYVYAYTPTVGGCDPNVAEYVVVLTRGGS